MSDVPVPRNKMVTLIHKGLSQGVGNSTVSVTKEVAKSLLHSSSYELPADAPMDLIMELSPPPLTDEQEAKRQERLARALET